jgi:hypothetical protein
MGYLKNELFNGSYVFSFFFLNDNKTRTKHNDNNKKSKCIKNYIHLL